MPVQVKRSGNTISIKIEHKLAGVVDANLVAGCIEAALECCSTSGCCDGRIALNEKCLATVAAHNKKVKCVDSCLGCN